MQRTRLGMWIAFWTSSALTLLADRSTWIMEWRSEVRLVFALASLLVAGLLLLEGERSRRSICLIVVGLLVGQWWMIKAILTFASWGLGEYKP